MMGSTIAKSNPQLAEDLEHLPGQSLRLVSSTLPRLTEAARQTGRSVRNSVADMAGSAGDAIQQALPGDAMKATGMALASTAALQAAQRGITRFAARRPMLFVLGGLAIVGGLILVSRRKGSGEKASGENVGDGKEIGEGSYSGARDYRDRTKAFLKAEGKQVPKRAKQAKKALESNERSELEAAEAEGRGHARS